MFDENAIVEKSKQLIWSKYSSWSAGELAVFDIYLSRINARKKETAEVIFTKKEYEKLMGIKEVRPEQLNRYVTNFIKNTVSIKMDNGWENYPLFYKASCKKINGEWEITLRCHPDLEWAFFSLADSGYQSYRLKYTLNLKSRYSKILYCLLKDRVFKHELIIDLKELRELLGATEKYYDSFNEFNRKILKRCESEINQYTDIEFEYEKIKRGRLTTGIAFKIKNKDLNINIQESEEITEQTDIMQPHDERAKIKQNIIQQIRTTINDINPNWTMTDEQIEEIDDMALEYLIKNQIDIFYGSPDDINDKKYELIRKMLIRMKSRNVKHPYNYMVKSWKHLTDEIGM